MRLNQTSTMLNFTVLTVSSLWPFFIPSLFPFQGCLNDTIFHRLDYKWCPFCWHLHHPPLLPEPWLISSFANLGPTSSGNPSTKGHPKCQFKMSGSGLSWTRCVSLINNGVWLIMELGYSTTALYTADQHEVPLLFNFQWWVFPWGLHHLSLFWSSSLFTGSHQSWYVQPLPIIMSPLFSTHRWMVTLCIASPRHMFTKAHLPSFVSCHLNNSLLVNNGACW
jgi:hypothetical protein